MKTAGAIPIEPPTGTWRAAGKGEGSRVADGREQQPLGAKAIDGGELGCNQEPVPIIDQRLHFVQEEHKKDHQRYERRVNSSWGDAANAQIECTVLVLVLLYNKI